MQTLDCKFEVKAITPEGRVTGYLSYFGNRDSQGDVVPKGAFDRTLEHRSKSKQSVPMLYQHSPSRPIGRFEKLSPDENGLYAEAQLALDTFENGTPQVPDAWLAFALAKAGILTGMSMGYEPVKGKTKYVDGDRHLLEVKLHEGSLVTFPANDLCRIEQVKGVEHFLAPLLAARKMDDFATALAAAQDRLSLSRLQDDIFSAFYHVITDLKWDEDDSDAKLALLSTSCDQLKGTLLDWAGRYLQAQPSGMGWMGQRMVFLPKTFGVDVKADEVALASLDLAPRAAVQLAVDALTALLVASAPQPDNGDGPGTPATDSGTVSDPDPDPAPSSEDMGDLHSLIADITHSIRLGAAAGEPVTV